MIEFSSTVPILRMFDLRKAKEFYCGFLGFSLDWQHRFEPNTPVYMQVSRGKVALHLSEHYGDGVPGSAIRIEMTGIEDYLRELQRRKYKYYRPGIQLQPWNAKEMSVIDPFGNRIHFSEFVKPQKRSPSKLKSKRRAQ
jgi:catechol 2,3-dioxygenase-like lactoylglutathione lyase family enzyme